jgi:hypothetical protein
MPADLVEMVGFLLRNAELWPVAIDVPYEEA